MNALALNLPTDRDASAAQAAIDVLRGVLLPGTTRMSLRPGDSTREAEVVLPAEAVPPPLRPRRMRPTWRNGYKPATAPAEPTKTTLRKGQH